MFWGMFGLIYSQQFLLTVIKHFLNFFSCNNIIVFVCVCVYVYVFVDLYFVCSFCSWLTTCSYAWKLENDCECVLLFFFNYNHLMWYRLNNYSHVLFMNTEYGYGILFCVSVGSIETNALCSSKVGKRNSWDCLCDSKRARVGFSVFVWQILKCVSFEKWKWSISVCFSIRKSYSEQKYGCRVFTVRMGSKHTNHESTNTFERTHANTHTHTYVHIMHPQSHFCNYFVLFFILIHVLVVRTQWVANTFYDSIGICSYLFYWCYIASIHSWFFSHSSRMQLRQMINSKNELEYPEKNSHIECLKENKTIGFVATLCWSILLI